MRPFNKLDIKFDTSEIKSFLESTDMWGEYPQRGMGDSPHKEMVDIWVRFKNPKECVKTGDWSSFVNEHESEWLKDVPMTKKIASDIMNYVEGDRLGGVLLTKLPPNGKISPHIDNGWHAEYYDKYYIPIKNSKGARFCFEGGEIDPEEGEVYAFRNDVLHWVENPTESDRIALIVCVKQSKLSKEGLCLGQQQQQ